MKWLITGGCGFLGSNLADTCLSLGQEVVVVDDLSRVGSEQNLAWLRSRHDNGWQFTQQDIRDATAIAKLVRDTQPDAIAHLAGQVAMTTSLQHPRRDFEINALGTLNVLEAVRAHQPEATVLYSSTNKVYGDLEWVRYVELATRYSAPDFPDGFNEEMQLDFHSPYGCSKGCADQYVLDYARMYGLHTVVFRHSSMYGGRQFATYDQGWIGWFSMLALEAQKPNTQHRFTISGNGKQVRDVLHVDDICRLYLRASEMIHAVSGCAFNVGGGMQNSLSLLELFGLLQELLGVELAYDQLPPRVSDQKVFVANCGKAARLLGWQPQTTARSGVARMLEWLQLER